MTAREERSDHLQADGEAGDGVPEEAARFIGETVIELAQLARRQRLDLLAHLLDMALMEADEIARRGLMSELKR